MSLKYLQSFTSYINEGYEEEPEYRITLLFRELKRNINDWFENGTLGANGAQLVSIDESKLISNDRTLMFDFQDDSNYYQVIVIVPLKEVGEDRIENCFIKTKKYDNDGNLLRVYSKNISVSELKEDKLIEMFSEIDEKSSSIEDETPDSLSQEDTDLGDTSLS